LSLSDYGEKFIIEHGKLNVNWLQLRPIIDSWHSGTTSVFDRRTFTVLCSTCRWRV